MTPRPNAGTRRAAASLMLVATGLLSIAGCDPRTLMYFLQPNEPTVPAPGPKLDGKRVVLITNAVSGSLGEYQSVDREISREVARIFREKVKKLDMVDPDKVSKWAEGHPNWTDPAELAKAFEADLVIFLEVEQFQVQNPADLNVYQGHAKTHIMVTEWTYPKNSKGKVNKSKPKEANSIYDDYRETDFPIRGPIPMDSGVSRNAFKTKFMKVAAQEISWHFVDHSPEDDVQDVKFNGR